MLDYHAMLVAALNTILPTHHEETLHSGLQTPCISYKENNNYVEANGDTIGYSRLSYQVKVWGNDLKDLQHYSKAIDAMLRPMGWKRTASGELYDHNSTMKQKILTYEALALEEF